MALITIGEIITQPAIYASVSAMAKQGTVGRYMGIISLVRGVGYAIGPWFVSVMFQNYFESPFILWSIFHT